MIQKTMVLAIILVSLIYSAEIFASLKSVGDMRGEFGQKVETANTLEDLSGSALTLKPDAPPIYDSGEEPGVAEYHICRRVWRCGPYGCGWYMRCYSRYNSEIEVLPRV